jgi:hypothetical protein
LTEEVEAEGAIEERGRAMVERAGTAVEEAEVPLGFAAAEEDVAEARGRVEDGGAMEVLKQREIRMT